MSDFVDQIIEGLKKPGKTQVGLAAALDTHPNVVGKIVKRSREVREREVEAIRTYLGLDTVRVVGVVGSSGDLVSFDADPDRMIGQTFKAPDGASPATVALYVNGESLGYAMAGSLLFYNDIQQPLEMVPSGWFCVVGMPDGGVRLRIPVPDGRGRFDLHPLVSGPALRDQRPLWAKPLLPSYARKIRPGI